ncbi:hypothetical protein HPG69_018121 [Diceros bicornis minor]|uniref:MHC class II beta chain N-terminal domain-containing protein n=1 Tax=Diceros bicornis minor TaxID=77932 RepID=A0A7J7EK12_DICBM|nr:hypothetical protein HPG69_018121 [Diceros bicornis minor]
MKENMTRSSKDKLENSSGIDGDKIPNQIQINSHFLFRMLEETFTGKEKLREQHPLVTDDMTELYLLIGEYNLHLLTDRNVSDKLTEIEREWANDYDLNSSILIDKQVYTLKNFYLNTFTGNHTLRLILNLLYFFSDNPFTNSSFGICLECCLLSFLPPHSPLNEFWVGSLGDGSVKDFVIQAKTDCYFTMGQKSNVGMFMALMELGQPDAELWNNLPDVLARSRAAVDMLSDTSTSWVHPSLWGEKVWWKVSATRGDSVSGDDPIPAAPQSTALFCDRFLSRGHQDQVLLKWAGGGIKGHVHLPYQEWSLDLSDNGDAGNDS